MEITNENTALPGSEGKDKLKSGPAPDEIEENGNIKLSENKKTRAAADYDGSRPVDQFFTQQSRGDVPSPIKAGTKKGSAATESLDLKLDETGPPPSETTHVQPEDLSVDFTDMLEVNILEGSVDSKLDQSRTDLLNESATSRKRPQTEMEPAVFEVPRMSKHPHTDSPPVPEFRDDSEPLIQFSSDSGNVFRVALQEGNSNDSVEPMSFQEASQVRTPVEKAVEPETQVSPSSESNATFIKALTSDFENPRGSVKEDRSSDASDSESNFHETEQNPPSTCLSLLLSIDEALDPIARAIYPCIQRKPGLNTAFVCIPLVVASLIFLYFRN